jgi:hypothetical protein
MITDSVPETTIDCDLCVIGSGPAGMVTALEYARGHPKKQVVLLEFGHRDGTGKNSLDESIRVLDPVHHHLPYDCTNKGLGGTSLTWGGRCVMYDEADFIPRPVHEGGCTWDADFLRDCDWHVAAASSYFECGTGPFRLPADTDLGSGAIAEGFREGEVLDSVVERWSMPTRFGSRYRGELDSIPNIRVLCGLEARDFAAPDSSGKVSRLLARPIAGGQAVEITARFFVIAAGTQESTRLILRNKDLFRNLDAPPESLGRFYQGHLSGKIASVIFSGNPRLTEYGLLRDKEGIFVRRRFQLPTEVLVRENLLNSALWLDNPHYHDPSHGSGVLSMMYLAMISPVIGKRLAPRAIANSITKGKVVDVRKHLFNVVKGLPGSLLTPAAVFYRRYCVKRKLPQIFLYNPSNTYSLHFHAEQVPSPENRMSLASDGETLEIRLRPSDADIDSVIRTHRLLDQWLRKCGCGRLDYWYAADSLPEEIRTMSRDGVHQNGTTRISSSPTEGVVDRDLRLWGTSNVYVCSGSVLPTSGQANPTFFTGVLAVRLARHLGALPA